MKFFINSSFNEQNSGIEHAQIKRAKLFRDHKEAFKLVFRDWNSRLHYYLNSVGISDAETLNMFDYFQKSESVTDQILQAKDLDFGLQNLTYTKDDNLPLYLVFQGESLLARVRYFLEDSNERVSMTELFDGFGNLYRVNHYDFRGFLSLSQWYTPDNKVGTEIWYDYSGKPVLEAFNRYNGQGEFLQAGWRLTAATSPAIYSFSTLDELTQHFFNLINADYWSEVEPNIFVLDRTHLGDWSLLSLERPAYTALHLHNSHAGDAQNPMHSVLNNFYEYSLSNANQYDAIISATEKQSHDVAERFAPTCKLFTIPVGMVDKAILNSPHVPISERSMNILMTCRIAPEKRIDHVIRAIGLAQDSVPNLTLDVYGYVDHRDDDEALKAINAAISEFNLQDKVKLHDYVNNVSAVQKDAQVYALTSVMEGFNLSLLEALSNGMVGVTYDVNYGPNELVVDGENGFVIPFDDIQGIANKFITLFNDPALLQTMSEHSYKLSERYSEENVWKAWQALIEDAKHKDLNFTHKVTKGLGNQLLS